MAHGVVCVHKWGMLSDRAPLSRAPLPRPSPAPLYHPQYRPTTGGAQPYATSCRYSYSCGSECVLIRGRGLET